MPTKIHKVVKIIWEDAKFYHFHEKRKASLTITKCLGEPIKENKDFVILKDCQQFVLDQKKDKFVLKRKAHFFFIPKGMIIET